MRLIEIFLAWLERVTGERNVTPEGGENRSVTTPNDGVRGPTSTVDVSRDVPDIVVVPSMPDRLSAHFTLTEATVSQTALRCGIDNTPPDHVVRNMIYAATHFERVRAVLGHPIHVSSWYRCPELNAAVGGSETSSHMDGYSIDFTCPGFGPPLVICKALEQHAVMDDIDQLIHEYGGWVHVSFDLRKRREKLTFSRRFGKRVGLVAV